MRRLSRYVWRCARLLGVRGPIEVRWADSLEGAIAQVELPEKVIFVGPDWWRLGERGRKSAIAHELLHCVWHEHSADDDQEEEVILRLETFVAKCFPGLKI